MAGMLAQELGQYPKTELDGDHVALKRTSRRCAGKTFSDPNRTAKFAALDGNCWMTPACHDVIFPVGRVIAPEPSFRPGCSYDWI
jgi:hypothetical protein